MIEKELLFGPFHITIPFIDFDRLLVPIFWVGDLGWVVFTIVSLRFVDRIGCCWLEVTGHSVLINGFTRFYSRVLDLIIGRNSLGFGGLKRWLEIWGGVYLSLVVSEAIPFGLQLSYLGFPTAVFVGTTMMAMWVSSFITSPVKFISGLVPAGVSLRGSPFIIPLVAISRMLRPIVLVTRLTMAAVITVTIDGIFHFWCV